MKNLDNPMLQVYHKNLVRLSESPFRSKCPKCSDGVLLVHRNQESMKLDEYDCCIHCGQRIQYLDINELRKFDGF